MSVRVMVAVPFFFPVTVPVEVIPATERLLMAYFFTVALERVMTIFSFTPMVTLVGAEEPEEVVVPLLELAFGITMLGKVVGVVAGTAVAERIVSGDEG